MKILRPLKHNDWNWPQSNYSSDPFREFFSDFDRMVDTFTIPARHSTVNFHPTCDIQETKDHFLVSFDMPGVKKDDVNVQMNGNQLTISGHRHREKSDHKGEQILRHERSYGKFQRTFTLPTSVEGNKIEAHYEDGVLNIAIPKAESSKPRNIQIQSGKGGIFSKFLGSTNKSEHKKLKDTSPS